MPNILDTIQQYISNLTGPTVVRSGNGYVDSDQAPQQRPKAKISDFLGNVFGGTKSVMATKPQEQMDMENQVLEQKLRDLGWQTGSDIPQSPPQQQMQQAPQQQRPNLMYPQSDFSDYIYQQAASPAQQENIDYLNNVVLPVTRKYGIPDALSAGQWAAEGRYRDPSTNNFWNLMYGGQIHPYQSMDNAARDYDLTLRDIASTNMGIPNEQFNYGNYDIIEILRALQSGNKRFEGHSERPMEYVDLVSNTPEFRHYYGK